MTATDLPLGPTETSAGEPLWIGRLQDAPEAVAARRYGDRFRGASDELRRFRRTALAVGDANEGARAT